jgi:hypothetical protein
MLTDGQARNGHPNLAWPRESLRGRIFAMNNSTRARAREGSRSNLAYTLPKCLKTLGEGEPFGLLFHKISEASGPP